MIAIYSSRNTPGFICAVYQTVASMASGDVIPSQSTNPLNSICG